MAFKSLPLGTLRARDEGRIYVKIQMKPPKWIRRSHLVYEQETGEKVPIGWVIHHRDENKTNDTFSNLELMTNADHVSLHKIGNKNRKGHKNSPEHIAKFVEARKGFRHSAESKARISKNMMGNKYGVGRVPTEETREKLGRVHRGVPKSAEQREKMSAARKAWWERKRKEI